MWKALNQVINIGINESLPSREQKLVRLTNIIGIIGGTLTTFGYIPCLFIIYPLSKWLIITAIVDSMLFYSVLVANRYHLYTVARLMLGWMPIVVLIILCFHFGSYMNFHFHSFLIIVAAFFIYPKHQNVYRNCVIVTASAVFLFFEFWYYSHPGLLNLTQEYMNIARLSSHLGFFIWISGFLYYITSTYELAEHLLSIEKRRSESLLHNILPKSIADRLKANQKTIADAFDETSILFADICDFTTFSEKVSPEKLVKYLNRIFSVFDDLVEKYNLEKIKTIGDSYMVAAGIPKPRPDHAEAIAKLALDIFESLGDLAFNGNKQLNMRIGIHSGPTIAGVIGKKKFAYDLWGDTVNTASRMESHGLPGRIQVTEATYHLLKDKFEFIPREIINVKGKGDLQTYFLKKSMG